MAFQINVPISKSLKFEELKPTKARYPGWNPIYSGSMIWISTDYYDGEKGMVAYDCRTEKFKPSIPYPATASFKFEPDRHSISGSEDDGLFLVDGYKGWVVPFDPNTKSYGEAISIPKLGGYSSSMLVKDCVHISHGYWNENNKYLIYSKSTQKVIEFEENLNYPRMKGVSVTKWGDDSKMYKFGGLDCTNSEYVNHFYIGSLENGDAQKPIIWKKCDEYQLLQPIYQCGFIQFAHYILIFGGRTTGKKKVSDIVSDIDILDLRSKKGWSRSHIRCPTASNYVAVLDDQQYVHLFTNNTNPEHHRISLRALIPDLDKTSIPKQVNGPNHDDEAKDEETEVLDLRAMNESLHNEVDRVKAEYAECKQQLVALEAKMKGPIAVIAVHQDEQKEAQLVIAELKEKVKELELSNLDVGSYTDWNWEQCLFWIMSLENGRFKPYEVALRQALSAADMTGGDLSEVSPFVLKSWTIGDGKEREVLHGHICDLVLKNGPGNAIRVAPQEQEGGATVEENLNRQSSTSL